MPESFLFQKGISMSSEDWITVRHAANISGYSEQYIRRLIRNGKIMGKKFGIVWQVSEADLIDYLRSAEKSDDKRYGPK